ncbi:MAG: adenine phosphoribosyltransferase [Firmicutes bacterium]|nr:adenine phosphoribosyltransferase [Bacillota bacterium]
MDLKKLVRTVPDFPKKGIMFRDITTILQDPDGLHESICQLQEAIRDIDYDVIVGPESRGFIFGVPLAFAEHKGFVPVRKPGKLPAAVYSQEYDLEYGTATLELHKDALKPGQKVLVVDDLLATGGTAEAIIKLIEQTGAKVVGFAFVVELTDLGGRERLKDYEVRTLVQYEGE